MTVPTDIQRWVGTYLIEYQINLDTSEHGDRPDPKECERSDRMAKLAWERLTNDAAKSYADLSAKISVAVEMLHEQCPEMAQEMLGAVMVDLRLMEAKAALEDDETEPEEPRLAAIA